jgi:hypothetical protein
VSNSAADADGSLRTLLLSVADAAEPLSARRGTSAARATARWLDGYRCPGQHIDVGLCAAGEAGGPAGDGDAPPPPPLSASSHPLSCSPYDARRDSAALDAALIELLIDRDAHAALGALAPGALVSVGPVRGAGFAPLLERADDAGLAAALEAGRRLLFVGAGADGWGAVRAALDWAPVAAAAGGGPGRVAAVLVAKDARAAPYVTAWDGWRAAGVDVRPTYTDAPPGDALALEAALFSALFGAGGAAAAALTGDDGVVLMAGVPGRVAAAIARRLADEGCGADRILFPDQ